MATHRHLDQPGPDVSYSVQLLLSADAQLDAATVLERVRAVEPSAVLTAAADGALALAFEAHPAPFAEGEALAQVVLTPGAPGPAAALEAALGQTWDWPEAGAALSKAVSAITVCDRLAGRLDRHVRLRLIHAVAHAVLDLAPVVALSWKASQRLVSPDAYRESLAHGAALVDAAVNVRLFRIADGRPGEHVMDTMGLAALGLRDLQIHFAGLDPQAVAAVLYGYAEYLFAKGDVLTDDSLVRGVESHTEWECKRTEALVEPIRDVVDIIPGTFAIKHD